MGSALVYKVNGFKNSNENQKNESRLCHSIPVALCRIEPEAERLYTRIILVVVILPVSFPFSLFIPSLFFSSLL